MPRPSRLRLSFDATDATCVAGLLWDKAPRTCAAVVGLLPIRGVVHQIVYSGSESVLVLDQVLRLQQDNATSAVRRDDLAFTWMAAGSSYGVTGDFAELCWFYDARLG